MDTLVLIYSLLGIIKKDFSQDVYHEQVEGLKLSDKARELSLKIPGGSAMYERKRWLHIPALTHRDLFREK